jgi:hypothetical protein
MNERILIDGSKENLRLNIEISIVLSTIYTIYIRLGNGEKSPWILNLDNKRDI